MNTSVESVTQDSSAHAGSKNSVTSHFRSIFELPDVSMMVYYRSKTVQDGSRQYMDDVLTQAN